MKNFTSDFGNWNDLGGEATGRCHWIKRTPGFNRKKLFQKQVTSFFSNRKTSGVKMEK